MLFSVYDDNTFSFIHEFNVFSIENFKIISNLGPLQRMSRMMKHISKAGKVDPGDRVTLTVTFACKPELTFRPVTRILCGGVLMRPKWTKLPKCIFYCLIRLFREVAIHEKL